MSTTSLAIMERAAVMLAEATTIEKAKELKDLALTAMDWARRRELGEEAIQHCRRYSLLAERRMGEMLAQTERAKGGQPYQARPTCTAAVQVESTLEELGISRKESAAAQKLAALPEPDFQAIVSGESSRADVKREVKRREVIANLESIKAQEVKAIQGVYDVIVIDPPWPMQRMELDSRPNAVAMPYPVMQEAELEALAIPCADDCHVWLWTTHKFLPMAFRLLDTWGTKYVCCFVWHKANSYQPLGLPKYNCEFALYARRGSPVFIDTKAFWACFNAPSGAHSEKPEEFYAVVRRVTAGRRLDMFSRRQIDGFDSYGQESK